MASTATATASPPLLDSSDSEPVYQSRRRSTGQFKFPVEDDDNEEDEDEQDIDDLEQPRASTSQSHNTPPSYYNNGRHMSVYAIPGSAPAGSSSFMHHHHHQGDASSSASPDNHDDEDDDHQRYQSPSLAKRRYPSTATTDTTRTVSAKRTYSNTKSRHASASADRKGKGVFRHEDNDPPTATSLNGHDVSSMDMQEQPELVVQGDGQLYNMLQSQSQPQYHDHHNHHPYKHNTAPAQTTSSSRHSSAMLGVGVPLRRNMTTFDPFTSTLPESTNRVRKKRSHTFDARSKDRHYSHSHTSSGGDSGNDNSLQDGMSLQEREELRQQASSAQSFHHHDTIAPKDHRVHDGTHQTSKHSRNSVTNTTRKHTHRSASDFASLPSSSSSQQLGRPQIRRPTTGSGTQSPLHPRSHSAGHSLASMPSSSAADGGAEGNSRYAPFDSPPTQGTSNEVTPVLKPKLSGLQMRSKARVSSARFPPSSSSTSRKDDFISPTHPTRKRAKSAIYPMDATISSQADTQADGSIGLTNNSTATPVRSTSSQFRANRRRRDSVSNTVNLDRYGSPDDRYLAVDEQRDNKLYSPPDTHSLENAMAITSTKAQPFPRPSSGILANKTMLKSASQPVSMAALLLDDASPATAPSSGRSQEPSLQELLSQVDLKSAMSLVRASGGEATSKKSLQGSPKSRTTTNLPGIRSSIEASSSYRTISPHPLDSQSFDSSQASEVSPAATSTFAARTPLLPNQGGGQISNEVMPTVSDAAGTHIPLSGTMRFNAVPDDTIGKSDKRGRRISIKRFLAGGSGKANRPGKVIEEEAALPLSDSNASANNANVENVVNDPVQDIRNAVSPTMWKYIASVKAELEIRYLPIYTALAMGQHPPNPLAVVRSRSALEQSRRSQSMHSLSPRSTHNDPYSAKQALSSSSRAAGPPALADRIRKKGHRTSIWEVAPRDLATFATSVRPVDDGSDFDRYRLERVDSGGRRYSHNAHRHASSEVSLGSLASIHEDSALNGFASAASKRRSVIRKHRYGPARMQGLLESVSLSPSRSRQSDMSSTIASDEPEGLASSRRGPLSGREDDRQHQSPLWSSDRHPQSSPEYNNHPEYRNSVGQARSVPSMVDEHGGLAQHRNNSKDSHHRIFRELIGRHQHLDAGTESEGLSDSRLSPRAASRINDSDNDDRLGLSHYPGKYRPQISRNASKSSSLVGLSRILGGKRSSKAFDPERNGYKSTDGEDILRGYASDSRSARMQLLATSEGRPDMNRTTSRLVQNEVPELTDGDHSDTSVFGSRQALQVEEVDIGDPEMERAERLLHDLRMGLSKAESLEIRVPPKMQTYMQEYFEHDARRMRKGQLAALKLAGAPILCQHFINEYKQKKKLAIREHAGSPFTEAHGSLQDGSEEEDGSEIDCPLDQQLRYKRRDSASSAGTSDHHTPLLELVSSELDGAFSAYERMAKHTRRILVQQEAARDKVTQTVKLANSVEDLISGDIFQQLRMLEDHLMRLRYSVTETRQYADAAWAVLSYILRIFFWFSWIGVITLRLIKATLLLPFTFVVTILRWIFF